MTKKSLKPSRNPQLESEIKQLLSLMPKSIRIFSGNSGKDIVDSLGEENLRAVALDVLSGINLRNSTESITRKRLASLNAALLVMFIKGQIHSTSFIQELPLLARDGLKLKQSKEDKAILRWILGLTDKASQNVLRGDLNHLNDYTKEFQEVLIQIAAQAKKEHGELSGQLTLKNIKVSVDWPFFLQLLGTVGSQTLSIRGSDKSTNGKFFEKLILGSLLHIFGFEKVDPNNLTKTNKVFWLSSREEGRESDATVLLEAGKAIRFDIGFIGSGNTEISLDKLSRFSKQIEINKKKWFASTIVIVDRIGAKSQIEEKAKRIKAHVVQMSLAYWPKKIAQILANHLEFNHELSNMPDNKIREYLKLKLETVPLENILSKPIKEKVNKSKAKASLPISKKIKKKKE